MKNYTLFPYNVHRYAPIANMGDTYDGSVLEPVSDT